MTLDFNFGTHGTAAPVNMVCQRYGNHMPHVKVTVDTDNGRWVGIDTSKIQDEVFGATTVGSLEGIISRVKPDGRYEVVITKAENAAMVYQKPLTAYDSPKIFTDESKFYNEAGSVVRTYLAMYLDRVDESAENFSGTPAVGAKVTGVDSDGKLIIGG